MINFSGQTRCSTCERVYIITIFQYLKRVRSLCYRISWIPTVPQTSVFPSAMAEFFVDFNGLYHKGAKLANTQYFWLPYLKHCLSGCRVSNCQPNSIAACFSQNIGSSPGFRRDETFTHMPMVENVHHPMFESNVFRFTRFTFAFFLLKSANPRAGSAQTLFILSHRVA